MAGKRYTMTYKDDLFNQVEKQCDLEAKVVNGRTDKPHVSDMMHELIRIGLLVRRSAANGEKLILWNEQTGAWVEAGVIAEDSAGAP